MNKGKELLKIYYLTVPFPMYQEKKNNDCLLA